MDDKPNSLEHHLISQFIESLRLVINPGDVNELLIRLRTIICNKTRTKKMRQVLVEAVAPLAAFGCGLCSIESMEDRLNKKSKQILKECGHSQFVLPVQTMNELTELADLLMSDSLHTPPITPTSPNQEDVFDFDTTQRIVRDPQEVKDCPSSNSEPKCKQEPTIHTTIRDNRRPPRLVRTKSVETESMTYRHSGIGTRCASLSADDIVPRYYDEQANQARYRSKNNLTRADVRRWEHDMFDPNY